MTGAITNIATTIILTTHYIDEAEEMADRIGVITKGELILVEEKAELIEECLANAFRAYARLMELGKQDVIYPSVLAKFAVKQVAVIGCPQIQLIDFDTVDPTNVTTQDYLSSDTHDWGQGRR